MAAGKSPCIWFLVFGIYIFFVPSVVLAQGDEVEFIIDVGQEASPLPKIFKPGVDLSGRGFHRDYSWPQGVAAEGAIQAWQKDIGFSGIYRLQYNLWEINQLAKNREAQQKLLANYEKVIKAISDAGGTVILDIFGTPAGLGKALDKKSPPWDLAAFKELIKGYIRDFSCRKKYNIWYEVWSAPDSDDFFLGRKQDYLNLYQQVAEATLELEAETKAHIPVGGPSSSWWFQNLDGNSVATAEKSLIYELIKFCYSRHLPLDFISWHAYSTGQDIDKEVTVYKKPAARLIRDWLTYFRFKPDTPLVVDEWNFDAGINLAPQRQESGYIAASYIPSRLKNMQEAGIDQQVYFCLEDFLGNREGITRNVGVFKFDPEVSEYKGSPKAVYSVFRMLSLFSGHMFSVASKPKDDFLDAIAAKKDDGVIMLVYNYIDPEIFNNYLSKNIATLSNAERKVLLDFIRADRLEKILSGETEVSELKLNNKVRALLEKAQELNSRAAKFKSQERALKITIKNLKDGDYLYQRYSVDSACSLNCEFSPCEEKPVVVSGIYQELLSVKPYSVNLIILRLRPPETPAPDAKGDEQPNSKK